MLTIWKYPLKVEDNQVINGPIVKFLDVMVQNEIPAIWAVVDEDIDYIEHHIMTVGTGHELKVFAKYLGSYMLLSGEFVGHVFIKAKAVP